MKMMYTSSYHKDVCTAYKYYSFYSSWSWSYVKLHVLQCTIFTVLLALTFIAGGTASAVNAADVQDGYIDPFRCDETSSSSEFCDDLEQLRDTQAAAAVSSYL